MQSNEVKSRFNYLNYRSVIGTLLYVSCCTRPDLCYAVNKQAKYSNNPSIVHYRALLHLIDFIKSFYNNGVEFYSKVSESQIYRNVIENTIELKEETIIIKFSTDILRQQNPAPSTKN